jgi:hypothetical protein
MAMNTGYDLETTAALNRLQSRNRPSSDQLADSPRARKKYAGPMEDRPIVNGKAVVSAEELADFRRQYGSDKTLRDLLNADKGLVRRKSPASKSAEPKKETPAVETRSAYDQRARGQDPVMRVTPPKEKSPFGTPEERAGARSMMAARQRADEFEADLAEKRRREDLMRPGRDAIEPVYPELMIAGPGAIGARSLATRAAPERAAAPAAREAPAFDLPPIAEARRARFAREMDDSLSEPAGIPELGRGVFRSARDKAEAEARNAKPRVQVEGTKGGVYRFETPKTESKAGPEFRSRTADRMDEMERGMKKGGKVTAKPEAYAKGGAVRGGGIEKRGKTKGRFV